MIREFKKEAKQFMSDAGYGKGTNFTTSQVSSLMARFAKDVVNKNGLSPDVSGRYCDYLSLILDGMKPEEAARECGLL